MQPFKVTCETCLARLKVQGTSAIGEIHACPKCGSMVQITPPPGWSPEPGGLAVVAALATPKAAGATPEPETGATAAQMSGSGASFASSDLRSQPSSAPAIPETPPVAPTSVASSARATSAAPTSARPLPNFELPIDLDAPASGVRVTPSPSEAAADQFAAAAAAAFREDVAPGAPPAPLPTPPSVLGAAWARLLGRPQLLLAVGGGTIAILFVGGLVAALWPSDEITSPAQTPAVAQAEPEADTETTAFETPAINPGTSDAPAPQPSPPATDEPRPAEPAPSLPTDANPYAMPQAAGDFPPRRFDPQVQPAAALDVAHDAVVENAPQPAAPADRAASDSSVGAPVGVMSQAAPPTADTAPAAGSRPPVIRFDPLDFDPAQLSLTPAPAARQQSPSAGLGDAADGSDPAIHDDNADPLSDSELFGPPADERARAVRIGPTPAIEGEAKPPLEQLNLPIQSLRLPPTPLCDLVAMVGDLAGVPITLDPAALSLVAIAPQTEVTVDVAETSLAELLRDVLARHRLELIERDGALIVARPQADQRRSVDYAVADLLPPGAADAADLGRLIERCVAPGAWPSGGGAGAIRAAGPRLRIDAPHDVHVEVLTFCERLRLARGLATRSRYPVERLAIESPYATLAPRLSRSTTFTFLAWTRLDDVLRHLGEAAGITVLVDWSALADEQLAPGTPIACSAQDVPLAQALDETLGPIGLGWWAVDGQTIQITSRGALVETARVEFLSIPPSYRSQFATAAALVEAVQKEMAADNAADPSPPAPAHVEIDAPSGRLIVVGSPDAQRLVARLLAAADTSDE